MTLCLFIENILHKLSILSHCLERETAVETDLRKTRELTYFDETNQEAWLNVLHQNLWHISSTLRYCGISYFLFAEYLDKPRFIFCSSYFSKVASMKTKNLHLVCCVRFPHPLSLSCFLSIFNVSSCRRRSIANCKIACLHLKKQTWLLSNISHFHLPGTCFKQEPHALAGRQLNNFILHRNFGMVNGIRMGGKSYSK